MAGTRTVGKAKTRGPTGSSATLPFNYIEVRQSATQPINVRFVPGNARPAINRVEFSIQTVDGSPTTSRTTTRSDSAAPFDAYTIATHAHGTVTYTASAYSNNVFQFSHILTVTFVNDFCDGVVCPANQCQLQTCLPTFGCVAPSPKPVGTSCALGAGVLGTCDSVGNCVSGVTATNTGACAGKIDFAACDDGNVNTAPGTTVCWKGACILNRCLASSCAPPTTFCKYPCDPSTGACTFLATQPNAPENTPCENVLSAFPEQVCRAGVCTGFNAPGCIAEGSICPDSGFDCICGGAGCACHPPLTKCTTDYDCSPDVSGGDLGLICWTDPATPTLGGFCQLESAYPLCTPGQTCADPNSVCQTDPALGVSRCALKTFACTTDAQCPKILNTCVGNVCIETATPACTLGGPRCPAGSECVCRQGGSICDCAPILPCASNADCTLDVLGEGGFTCDLATLRCV